MANNTWIQMEQRLFKRAKELYPNSKFTSSTSSKPTVTMISDDIGKSVQLTCSLSDWEDDELPVEEKRTLLVEKQWREV